MDRKRWERLFQDRKPIEGKGLEPQTTWLIQKVSRYVWLELKHRVVVGVDGMGRRPLNDALGRAGSQSP